MSSSSPQASSPQRFNLIFYGCDRVQRRQMQPLANVWIRAAAPLQYYRQPNRSGHDLASVGNGAARLVLDQHRGVYGRLNAVEVIGLSMQAPLGKPMIEIRSVRLSKQDPGSVVLDKKPVVDRFGQWIPSDWAAEEAGLGAGDFVYCKYGDYLNTKATGFFRVEQLRRLRCGQFIRPSHDRQLHRWILSWKPNTIRN